MSPQTVFAGLLVFITALTVRLVFLTAGAGSPSFLHPVIDAQSYHFTAASLANGAGVSRGLFWQPVFYPLYLASVYKMFGVSILAAKVAQAVIGSVTCVLVCLLGKRVFSLGTGLLAGLIMAFYGPLVFVEGELLSEGWAVFWAVSLLLLFPAARRAHGPILFLLLGVAQALAVLTRPTFLPFLVVASAWLVVGLYRDLPRSAAMRQVALMIVGAAFIALPVGNLCRQLTGRFSILPFSSGINFFIGNNPRWEETVAIRPGAEWTEIVSAPGESGIQDPWASSAYFSRLTREHIRADPGGYAGRLAAKLERFVSSREIPRNSSIYVQRRWSPPLRFSVWKLGRFGFPFGVVFPLSVIGLAVSWKKLPFPFLAFLLLYPLAVILYFVSDRYRIPYLPALILLAAAGLVDLAGRLRRGHWTEALAGAGACVVIAFLISVTPLHAEERINYAAELQWAVAKSRLQQGEPDRAIEHLREALRLDPDLLDANNDLGILLRDKGDAAAAIALFQRAAAIAPGNSGVLYNLGVALLEENRFEESVAVFTRAARISSTSVEIRAGLAVALARAGRYDAAIDQYHVALATAPDNATILVNLGHAYATLGRFDEAAACYSRALEIQPGNVDARARLGVLRENAW